MLYRGALKFLNQAGSAIERKDLEGAHRGLVRCQDVLRELQGGLDLTVGEIAVNLSSLYDYMIGRLVTANCMKDREPVDEVQELLRSLLTAWEEAVAADPQS